MSKTKDMPVVEFRRIYLPNTRFSYPYVLKIVKELYENGDILMYKDGKPKLFSARKNLEGRLSLRNDQKTIDTVTNATIKRLEGINKNWRMISSDPNYPLYDPNKEYSKGDKLFLKKDGNAKVIRAYKHREWGYVIKVLIIGTNKKRLLLHNPQDKKGSEDF